MANQDHVEVFTRGPASFLQWRKEHPDVRLDCTNADFSPFSVDRLELSNADFTGATFGESSFIEAVLDNVNLDGVSAEGIHFESATLKNVSAIGARFQNGLFKKAVLTDVVFNGADLKNCSFEYAKLETCQFEPVASSELKPLKHSSGLSGNTELDNVIFIYAALDRCRFIQAALTRGDFAHSSVDGVRFDRATMNSTNFESGTFQNCSFRGASLASAKFSHSQFSKGDFRGAILSSSSISRTDFGASRFSGASFRAASVDWACMCGADISDADFLSTKLRLGKQPLGQNRPILGVFDARQLDRSIVDATEYHIPLEYALEKPARMPWDRIRRIGRLPIFAASTGLLIGVPLFNWLLYQFDRSLRSFEASMKDLAESSDDAMSGLAGAVVEHIHFVPIPSQMAWAFFGTLALFIASLLYQLACPTRVQQYTRDQWVDELGNSMFHYDLHAFSRPILRRTCFSFYVLGTFIMTPVILKKFWSTLSIISSGWDGWTWLLPW